MSERFEIGFERPKRLGQHASTRSNSTDLFGTKKQRLANVLPKQAVTMRTDDPSKAQGSAKPVEHAVYYSDDAIKKLSDGYLTINGKLDHLMEKYYSIALALQLLFLKASEFMGNHDLKIVDAGGVD